MSTRTIGVVKAPAQAVLDEYNANTPVADIAAKYGVCRMTVRRILKEQGIVFEHGNNGWGKTRNAKNGTCRLIRHGIAQANARADPESLFFDATFLKDILPGAENCNADKIESSQHVALLFKDTMDWCLSELAAARRVCIYDVLMELEADRRHIIGRLCPSDGDYQPGGAYWRCLRDIIREGLDLPPISDVPGSWYGLT